MPATTTLTMAVPEELDGWGLERHFRDARLGRIHPANRYVTHEVIGKAMMGVDLTAELRWG